jgi:hypothetical protein
VRRIWKRPAAQRPVLCGKLAALDRLAAEIENAPTLEVVEAIANAAAGYQRQFKDVFEVADRSGAVWVDAEVKIGTELAKMPGAKRGAGPGRGKVGAKAAPTFGGPTLEEIGVDKKRSARAKRGNDGGGYLIPRTLQRPPRASLRLARHCGEVVTRIGLLR